MTKLAGRKLIMAGVGLGALVIPFFAMPHFANAQGVKETEASRALVRLDDLEAQIRELTNRVEILESQNAALKGELEQRKATADNGSPTTNNAQEIASPLEDDIYPAAAPVPAPIQAETPPPAQTSSQPSVQAVPTPSQTVVKQSSSTAVGVNKPTAVPPAAAVTSSSAPTAPKIAAFDATKVLQTAKTQIQAGEYQNAEVILTDFTENHADDANSPEAFWLLGETRYVQQAWAPAAQAYVAYLNKAPTGAKVPDVLVRIAGAFRELGDNNQRCKALNEYKRRAPNPSAILKARAEAEMAKAACP